VGKNFFAKHDDDNPSSYQNYIKIYIQITKDNNAKQSLFDQPLISYQRLLYCIYLIAESLLALPPFD